jgi:hypothetical protein
MANSPLDVKALAAIAFLMARRETWSVINISDLACVPPAYPIGSSNLKRWGLGVYHGLRKTNLQHVRLPLQSAPHTACGLRHPALHRHPHRSSSLPRPDPQGRLARHNI